MPIGFDNSKVQKPKRVSAPQEDVTEMDDLRTESEEDSDFKEKKKGLGKTQQFVILAAIFIVAIVVILCLFKNGPKDSTTLGGTEVASTEAVGGTAVQTQNSTQQNGVQQNESANNTPVYDENGAVISNNGVYDEDGNVIAEGAINPGITEYAASENNKTTATVYSESDFIKDLNGVDVSAVYNVQKREYIKDYVNYETRRAIIDDGMELYWVEATYKGKRYRFQTPFYYFKDLDEAGICKVEMEVLTLEGGAKIISYMQIVEDVK